MLNFLIKQILYIRFFLGNKTTIAFKDWLFSLFYSDDFDDGQWEKDVWYYTKDYRQGFGKVFFTAKLDGLFEENIWPAMWLIYNTKDLYYEIDIELWGKDKYPRLVFTSWLIIGKELERKRISYKCSKFIKKLQSEFHEYTISRSEKGIRFYIDNILAGSSSYTCNAEMTIAAGNVSIKEIIATK